MLAPYSIGGRFVVDNSKSIDVLGDKVAVPHCMSFSNDVCNAKRCHLQFSGGALQEIGNLLNIDDIHRHTMCTCTWGLAHACYDRLRIGDKRFPWEVRYRALEGYQKRLCIVYRLMKHLSGPKRTLEQVVRHYTGAKRALYERSLRDYVGFGLGRIIYPAFCKWGERAPISDMRHRTRAIVPQYSFGQGPESRGMKLPVPILLELTGRHAQEEALPKFAQATHGRITFATGMTPEQRAATLAEFFNEGLICQAIDLTAFDGSQGVLAVEERKHFLRQFGNGDPDLQRVIRSQNRPKLSSSGLKCESYGFRQSGTGGTAVANKLVMIAALLYATEGAKGLRFFCDGDDTILAFPPDQLRYVRSWFRRMKWLGLATKPERLAYNLEEVVFCRASPVLVNGKWTMIKRPTDALCTVFCVVRHFRGNQLMDYLATLSVGYGNLWSGCPVLCAVGDFFSHCRGNVNKALLSGSGSEYGLRVEGRRSPSVVTEEARVTFARAFGISKDEQLLIEALLRDSAPLVPGAALSARNTIPCRGSQGYCFSGSSEGW